MTKTLVLLHRTCLLLQCEGHLHSKLTGAPKVLHHRCILKFEVDVVISLIMLVC